MARPGLAVIHAYRKRHSSLSESSNETGSVVNNNSLVPDVSEFLELWEQTFNVHAPERLVVLYADDALFQGTSSAKLCIGAKEIGTYFHGISTVKWTYGIPSVWRTTLFWWWEIMSFHSCGMVMRCRYRLGSPSYYVARTACGRSCTITHLPSPIDRRTSFAVSEFVAEVAHSGCLSPACPSCGWIATICSARNDNRTAARYRLLC